MKKLIVIVISSVGPAIFWLIFSSQTFAQAYHIFPDSNANWIQEETISWTLQGTGIIHREYYGIKYSLSHDTTINAKQYTLITSQHIWSFYTNDNVLYAPQNLNSSSHTFGALREDSNKKIWFINFINYSFTCYTYSNSFWPWAIDSDLLLYDFNLHVGENLTYPFPRQVNKIDSIKLEDNSYRKRFVFSDPTDYWLEGIGSSLGLFGAYKLPTNPPNDLNVCSYWLNCFSQNSQVLFEKSNLIAGITCDSLETSTLFGSPQFANNEFPFLIFPNPTENLTTIQFSLVHQSRIQISVFDISGKEILILVNDEVQAGIRSLQINTSDFAKGVYILKMISDSEIETRKLVVR